MVVAKELNGELLTYRTKDLDGQGATYVLDHKGVYNYLNGRDQCIIRACINLVLMQEQPPLVIEVLNLITIQFLNVVQVKAIQLGPPKLLFISMILNIAPTRVLVDSRVNYKFLFEREEHHLRLSLMQSSHKIKVVNAMVKALVGIAWRSSTQVSGWQDILNLLIFHII